MIKNVVFDVGNVLERFDPERFLSALVPNEEMRRSLRGQVFSTPTWLMLDRGTLDERAAVERLCAQHPAWRATVAELVARWTELMEPFPHSVELLRRLRAEGYRLYVLSNYHAPFFWRVAWHAQLRELMDGLLISSDVRLLKPDPAIFHCLCERFELLPEQTLFLDDSAANVEVAEYIGFQALHVREPAALELLRPN